MAMKEAVALKFKDKVVRIKGNGVGEVDAHGYSKTHYKCLGTTGQEVCLVELDKKLRPLRVSEYTYVRLQDLAPDGIMVAGTKEGPQRGNPPPQPGLLSGGSTKAPNLDAKQEGSPTEPVTTAYPYWAPVMRIRLDELRVHEGKVVTLEVDMRDVAGHDENNDYVNTRAGILQYVTSIEEYSLADPNIREYSTSRHFDPVRRVLTSEDYVRPARKRHG